ncbi:MAG: DUF1566 domain-containing protein [Bacteroidetes bacterium]|nr:DUF1566 domain-containing protein [Bacteroidota bacterium]
MKKLIFILHFSFFIFYFSFGQQGAIQLPVTGQTTSYYPGDDGDLQMGVQWPTQRFTDHGNGTCTDTLTGLIWLTDGNLMASRDPDFDQDYNAGDGSVNWTTALDYVARLNQDHYLGYNNWRLPNIQELMSLLDLGVPDTALSLNHPFHNIQQSYWSSTTGYDKGIAFVINMFEWEINSVPDGWPGQVHWYRKELDLNYYADKRKVYVLPVRGELGNGLIKLPRTHQEKSYYPGDDLDLSFGIPWPTPRFIDHNDSTVTDRLTGLMWTQNANPFGLFGFGWEDGITWGQALGYIDSLNNLYYSGHNDWRLPNRNEMLSLRDFGGEYLYSHLPQNHPFTHPHSSYWTSTTSASSSDRTHDVCITLTDVTHELDKEPAKFRRVWPVRDDNSPLTPGSIQGNIMQQGEPLKDAILQLSGPINANVHTNENGDYAFSHLPPGNYTLIPEKPYYTFDPPSINLTISDQSEIRNFTASLTATHGWRNLRNNLPESGGIRDMHFIGQKGWLAGGADKMYYTPDGGETFEIQYLPEKAGITTSICMKNIMEGYVVTANGVILKTINGGSEWNIIHEPGGVLNAITFPPASDTGYTCGSNGTIWAFDDNTITNISPAGVSDDLLSVSFPESNGDGKVCGHTTIRRFFNSTWNNLQFYDSSRDYFSIFFINDLEGWAAGSEGFIIHTTDGTSWLLQTTNITHSLFDIFFLNLSEGWTVGYDHILKTTNGGEEWLLDASGFTEGMSLTTVYFVSPDEGYVGGNDVFLKYGSLTGIEDDEQGSVFQNSWDVVIYPNPTTSQFKIQSPKFKVPLNVIKVEIVDIYGKVVLEEKKGRGEEDTSLDVSKLPAGVYFVRIMTKNKMIVKKVIKQ